MKFHQVRAISVCVALASALLTSSALAQSIVTLGVSPAGAGTVAQFPGEGELVQGGEVTVTATAAEGYEFVGWQGDIESISSTVSFLLTEDTELTAVFQEAQSEPGVALYALTAFVEPSGSGTIVRDVSLFDYEDGSEVTLTAYADEGFVFAGWTGDLPEGADASDPVLVLVMDGDKNVLANYSAALTLEEGENGESGAPCGTMGFASLGLIFGMMLMMKLGRPRW